jgi:hypothetical protein
MTVPVHTWVMIEPTNQEKILAFTYVDPMAGLSAKGSPITDLSNQEQILAAIERPALTYRLPSVPLRALSVDELNQLNLPDRPDWLMVFLRENEVKPAWREDAKLKDKFHARHPDDLKVIFFFPEIRRAEAMWVRIIGLDAEIGGYRGILLNQPQSAKEPKVQSVVSVRSTVGVPEPVYVSPTMRANWFDWRCVCRGCGFDLLFETVEDMKKRLYTQLPPNTQMQMFTSRCLLCAETVVIENKHLEAPVQRASL